jgi:hypothetical protein
MPPVVQALLPLVLLAAAGGWWARHFPDADNTRLRLGINQLVLNLFAPALLFSAAAGARLEPALLVIPATLALAMLALAALLYALFFHGPLCCTTLPRPTRAALLLAAVWGNVFFIGYPLSVGLYGPQAGAYAAFADLLASSPLLWTLGVWLAVRLGGASGAASPPVWRTLLGLPPVWGFAAGLASNLLGWNAPALLDTARFIGQPAIPLMLFVLGLAIPWRHLRPDAAILAGVAAKLVAAPLLALGVLTLLPPLETQIREAALLMAAMPSMLFALVMADRFQLDIEAAAGLLAWSTLLSMLTLPAWLALLRS